MPDDLALLIGINEYRDVPDLRGCVNDVADARSLLMGPLGYSLRGIRTIRDAEAVRANVEDGLEWLRKGAKPQSRIYLHWSGHGSFTADQPSGPDRDEADGYDELFCLHDMAWGNPRTYVLDDELRHWVESLPPVQSLTIVLDTCHSGTGLRDLSRVPDRLSQTGHPLSGPEIDRVASLARAGAAPPIDKDTALRYEVLTRFAAPPPKVEARARALGQPKPRRELARSVARAAGAKRTKALLIAACRPDQTAADAWFPEQGRYQGAHTRAVCDAFRANPKITPASLRKRLVATIQAGQFEQEPQVEVA